MMNGSMHPFDLGLLRWASARHILILALLQRSLIKRRINVFLYHLSHYGVRGRDRTPLFVSEREIDVFLFTVAFPFNPMWGQQPIQQLRITSIELSRVRVSGALNHFAISFLTPEKHFRSDFEKKPSYFLRPFLYLFQSLILLKHSAPGPRQDRLASRRVKTKFPKRTLTQSTLLLQKKKKPPKKQRLQHNSQTQS